ncbi:MAG: single-stranded DNA-binding protein [Bacteroidales bacterium]
MYQKTTIIGNLGQDPELKQLDGGLAVVSFTVATNETYKNKSGEKVTNTEWHRIEAWRGMAETIAKYCKKGDMILLEGKIKTDQYEKNGEKRYTTKIIADNFRFMPGAKKEEAVPTPKAESNDPDDLPF